MIVSLCACSHPSLARREPFWQRPCLYRCILPWDMLTVVLLNAGTWTLINIKHRSIVLGAHFQIGEAKMSNRSSGLWFVIFLNVNLRPSCIRGGWLWRVSFEWNDKTGSLSPASQTTPMSIYRHTSRVAQTVAMSVEPPLWYGLKYRSDNDWMNCHQKIQMVLVIPWFLI